MKKWMIYVIAATVIALVLSNLFLILKDDSKAERTIYINDWTRIANGNVTKTFDTEGVALPESEYYIYSDASQGSVSTFYVKEGDAIAVGTPLFSYGASELEERKAEIEVEISRLQGELESIEMQIAELNRLEFNQPSTFNGSDSSEIFVNIDVTAIVEGNVAQSIAAAEADRGKIEASIMAKEQRLEQITEQISNLTVFSTVEGEIIRLQEDLAAPLITVTSSTLVIKGILSEQQMKDVVVGQKVMLNSEIHHQKFSGLITQVSTFPNEEPSIGMAPFYSFIVVLDEETSGGNQVVQVPDEETVLDAQEEQIEVESDREIESSSLLIGSGLEMKIIIEEAFNVPLIPSDSLTVLDESKFVYRLTSDGIVQKQEIVLGLSFDGKSEIRSGLNANHVVVTNPKIVRIDGAFFITPLQTARIQKDVLSSMSNKQYVKYILMGLLDS